MQLRPPCADISCSPYLASLTHSHPIPLPLLPLEPLLLCLSALPLRTCGLDSPGARDGNTTYLRDPLGFTRLEDKATHSSHHVKVGSHRKPSTSSIPFILFWVPLESRSPEDQSSSPSLRLFLDQRVDSGRYPSLPIPRHLFSFFFFSIVQKKQQCLAQQLESIPVLAVEVHTLESG